MGLEHEAGTILEPEDMLPAAGQGAIGIQLREDDHALAQIFDAINCQETLLRVSAERGVLQALGGSCHTPVGAFAEFEAGDMLHLRACLVALDGSESYFEEGQAVVTSVQEASAFGISIGEAIKTRAPAELLSQRAA